jgi:hypothetical protein
VSRRSDAKKARRKKRRAAQDARWIPDTVIDSLSDDIELAATLEAFDERITERGWISALWFYPPSHADVTDPDEVVSVTTIVLTANEDGDVAHVVFVGTDADYQFDLEELFEHIDAVEAYRLGDPAPTFGS